MKSIKIYGRLATRTKQGKRSRKLSTRTLSTLSANRTLLLDLDYLSALLSNRTLSSAEIQELIYKLLYASKVSGISIISSNQTKMVGEISANIHIGNIKDTVYTTLLKNPTAKYVVFTDNLSCWGLSNFTSDLYFCTLDTNKRFVFYNNKTGLDFFGRFIRTQKVVNKLGLDALKYMNLQYLYVLLLYLAFKHQKTPMDFELSPEFLSTATGTQLLPHKFYNSAGIGLSLIAEAHKLLSYAFLTKPEYCDYFLFSEEYLTHLPRLQKLLPIDYLLLEKFYAFYKATYAYTLTASANTTDISCTINRKLSAYSHLMANTVPEHPTERRILERLKKRLQVQKIVDKQVSKPSDNSSIDDYVANLLQGMF